VLREGKEAFHVQLPARRLLTLDLGQHGLLSQPVALALVGLLVNLAPVDEGILKAVLPLSQFRYAAL
jgi:hypothetical protein